MSGNVFSNPETTEHTNNAAPTAAPPVQPEVKQAEAPAPDTLFADQLSKIVTDDGRQKYADVSTALSSLAHAQAHIAELTRKNKELEETVSKARGIDEVLDRINSARESNSEQPSGKSLSEAEVSAMLEQMLNQKEKTSKAIANEVAFSEELRKKYGDKAQEKLAAKAAELGVGVEFLQSLVQKSPKAALVYFKEDGDVIDNSTTPGINTTTFGQKPPTTDPKKAALERLMGSDASLVNKWRAAAARKDN